MSEEKSITIETYDEKYFEDLNEILTANDIFSLLFCSNKVTMTIKLLDRIFVKSLKPAVLLATLQSDKKINISDSILQKLSSKIDKKFIYDAIEKLQQTKYAIKITEEKNSIEGEIDWNKKLSKIDGFVKYICHFSCLDDLSRYGYEITKFPKESTITLCDIDKNTNHYMMISEYIEGPTLLKYLEKQKYTKDQLFSIISQILYSFITAYEKMGFVHNDVNFNNFIIQNTTVESRRFKFKNNNPMIVFLEGIKPMIIDFGNVEKSTNASDFFFSINNFLENIQRYDKKYNTIFFKSRNDFDNKIKSIDDLIKWRQNDFKIENNIGGKRIKMIKSKKCKCGTKLIKKRRKCAKCRK